MENELQRTCKPTRRLNNSGVRRLILMMARVAELVDATDLKSVGGKPPCRFESGPGHQNNFMVLPHDRV